jgi:hypothetical protein
MDKQTQAKATAGESGVRRITLVRGRHHWTLECVRGEEAQLLRHISECVLREGYPLDRFDAAVISHQLCERTVFGLNKVPDKAD